MRGPVASTAPPAPGQPATSADLLRVAADVEFAATAGQLAPARRQSLRTAARILRAIAAAT